MNKKRDDSLEVLLKDSLRVSQISNTKNLHQSLSSSNNVVKKGSRKPKSTQSSHKDKPSLVRYPLKNIPLGLEEQSARPKPKQVKKQSSTLEFIEKLKQIDVDTKPQNASFLEQAKEEINVAFQQLQEIQKLIARKLLSEEKPEETPRNVAAEEARQSLISSCNKQFEQMQKKYLNKTKIYYKSLQDFENMTLDRDKNRVSEERLPPPPRVKEVKVLFTNKKQKTDVENKSVVISTDDRRKTLGINSENRSKIDSGITADDRRKIMSLLKNEDVKRKGSDSQRIKYLLKPEHSGRVDQKDTSTVATKTEVLIQTDDSRPNRIRFHDRKPNDHSILKNIVSTPSSSSDSEELESILEEAESQDSPKQKQFLLPRHQRKLQKIDESISVCDNVDQNPETYSEGRNKLNLLLYGKEKIPENENDCEIANSVLKSSYLSKEFGVETKKKPVRSRNSTQLIQTVLNKFRDYLAPGQLANLRQRDWNLTLRDSLFTQIQK